jgi:hypothetical protein
MQYHVILASGPFLTPETFVILLALFASPAIALVFLVVSVVMFVEKKRSFSVFCLTMGLLFLIPLLGILTNGKDLLTYFGIVSVIAVCASLCYSFFYVHRKM